MSDYTICLTNRIPGWGGRRRSGGTGGNAPPPYYHCLASELDARLRDLGLDPGKFKLEQRIYRGSSRQTLCFLSSGEAVDFPERCETIPWDGLTNIYCQPRVTWAEYFKDCRLTQED